MGVFLPDLPKRAKGKGKGKKGKKVKHLHKGQLIHFSVD
jgi:hypothetical protein